MTPTTIRDAVTEAQRFIDRANAALSIVETHEYANGKGSFELIPPSRESGALRRASLDLTRALADMRRP